MLLSVAQTSGAALFGEQKDDTALLIFTAIGNTINMFA